MITLKNICKTFKISKRNAGLSQAFQSMLHKEYTTVKALDNVSFSIQEGEMVGYIGPNGAGKSSTIKIMSGILTPDSGQCVINGNIPWKNRVQYVRDIGVVFGQRSQLWWDVPVIDSFELLREIYQIENSKYKNTLDMLVEQLDIASIIKTPTRQLSLGQRMRCEIAASLLHSPKIVFLDEPTIGLDAISKIAVRDFIIRINKEQKTTIILTTHDMQDIEALTKRILLIGKGKILLDGDLTTLKNQHTKHKKIMIEYSSGTLHLCEGLANIEQFSGRAVITVDTELISISAAISFLCQNLDVRDISVSGTSTEELVVSLYREHNI